MKKQDQKKRAQAKPGLAMRELMAMSGLPRSTILYYVDQGLLPPPVKTSRNMAYYPAHCVERLNLIKTLQSRQRLPLDKIRRLLEMRDQGREIAPFVELIQVIFGLDEQAGEPLSPAELARQSGLSEDQVAELVRASLLIPLHPGVFDQQDLAMAKVYAGGLAAGISLSDMEYYPRLGAQIVEQEINLRRGLTAQLPDAQNAAVSLRMVQAARAIRGYVIDRLFQQRIAAMGSLQG